MATRWLLVLAAIGLCTWRAGALGCCCCVGRCAYSGSPPCPCPMPPPGRPQPKCPVETVVQLYLSKYSETQPPDLYPARTAVHSVNGKPTLVWDGSTGWTSGFYPGLLWQLANSTDDVKLAHKFHQAALAATAGRAVEANDTSSHDVGFMVFGSFGNGYELGDLSDASKKQYGAVIVQAAHSLATRWSSTVGMIRSWGKRDDDTQFEVIIDNLMNLELLFWASKYSGNTTLKTIAHAHALKTGQLWLRADNSTAHLCVFAPATGKLLKPCTGTPQGYAANSTWARGQAWGIYGWTMAYRYTKDSTFLEYAARATEYYMRNANAPAPGIPSGVSTKVPLWDFNAPADQYWADTSAAAITASALLELSPLLGNSSLDSYARDIINSMASFFVVEPSSSQAVFFGNRHDGCGVGATNPNCTIIETEYYMLEALRRIHVRL